MSVDVYLVYIGYTFCVLHWYILVVLTSTYRRGYCFIVLCLGWLNGVYILYNVWNNVPVQSVVLIVVSVHNYLIVFTFREHLIMICRSLISVEHNSI